jgi:hypothetical protein
MNFEFQNIIMQIYLFIYFLKNNQRMSLRFQLILYHNVYYTSPFFVKKIHH